MVACPSPLSNFRCGFIAVHLGHLTVHEYQLKRQALNHLDGFLSVCCDIDTAAQFFQHAHGNFLVDDIILCLEHAGTKPVGDGIDHF